MRVRDKRDKREGEATKPAKDTFMPPGDQKGFILNGINWYVQYDDGEGHVFSPGAFAMLFEAVEK